MVQIKPRHKMAFNSILTAIFPKEKLFSTTTPTPFFNLKQLQKMIKFQFLNKFSFHQNVVTSIFKSKLSWYSTVASASSFRPQDASVSMIQGASRGIGLEFVKQLLERNSKENVIATCRNPDGAAGLIELKNKYSERLHIQRLDLTIESTIEESARAIGESYGHLNLLVNASGILSIPGVIQPETTLTKLERSSLMLAYEVNAVGPVLVTKVGGGSGTERDVAVVANISARVGSIGDNRLGGWHSYRSSKTALNQLTKCVAVEFARKKDPVICILLHPGTVGTDLSKPFQKNVPKDKLFTKEFSVQKLLSIIDSSKSHDNGKFFAWDGQEIPW